MNYDKYLPVCEQELYNFDIDGVNGIAFCGGVAEIMCDSTKGGGVTSGGGFSNVYPRQPWQDNAVSYYLNNYNDSLPPQGTFNSSGRGYPDVSAYGGWTYIYIDGELRAVSGTSEATPIMAGMVTLLNDMRFAYGQPPMGFLNPFLYDAAAHSPGSFNDIVVGENKCADFGPYCCEYSFKAQPGWDATTGLGSPNFQALASLALNPQNLYPTTYANSEGKHSLPFKYHRCVHSFVVFRSLNYFLLHLQL